MILQRNKIELFCWSSLFTLIVLSCAGSLPWWVTLVYAVALAVLLRIWVWALRRGLSMFHQRYTHAADTVREYCAPEVIRRWAFLDDEIERSYRFDDDDDDDGGGHTHAEPEPV